MLRFSPDVEIEFVDREKGIRQIYDYAERGMRTPLIVFGPEGCGKSAWLRQSAEILRENGYEVLYIDLFYKEFTAMVNIKEVINRLSQTIAEVAGVSAIKIIDVVISIVIDMIKRYKMRKIAVLIDEIFQAIGLDKAETYVKTLLNLIEYPPASYENIVIIMTTSEGVSRWRIGRHRWADISPMWNMSREGFEILYMKIPGEKPSYEEIWRITGGNPFMTSILYLNRWDHKKIIEKIIREKALSRDFINKWRRWLEIIIKDIDFVSETDFPEDLRRELIERNLIIYDLYPRNKDLWIDDPPPEKDLEIGVGRYVAWQTPLHREAVRKALESP